VASLVAIGAAAGLPDAEARSVRRNADATWARMLREEGLEAFLAAWEAQPLFASQRQLPPATQAWLRQLREGQQAEGLALSLEAFGLGAQPPLHDALPAMAMPTWLLAGEHDSKFTAIAHDLAGRMPHASAMVVPDCGHNVPLENPAFLVSFLARTIAPAPLERSPA
ncbi:MAG: alpha/beta fold hydrolase, partial [Candidatus Sericytochromatia bacterium]